MAAADNKSGFNMLAVATSTVAVLVFVFVLALFLQGGFRAARNIEHEAKVLAPVDEVVADYGREQQAKLLEGYRWIDREQGKVGLPVERAVELVVQRQGGGR